tara:strand:- start:7477 stop:8115 length:639 start_codon:yes stop_codon:yes gene_type:complete
MEEFKDIPCVSGYQVSNKGRVRNGKTLRVLTPRIAFDKFNVPHYSWIAIYVNKVQTIYTIHRLVALTWIPNPENKLIVDHIDRNRTNNDLENLRWATPLENAHNRNPYRTNTTGEPNICFCNKKKRFLVHIQNDYKVSYLGSYKTLQEAKEARDKNDYKPHKREHKYIFFIKKYNGYKFEKVTKGKYFSKMFKILEEAVEYRDKYLASLIDV